jgi:hypothetical protein
MLIVLVLRGRVNNKLASLDKLYHLLKSEDKALIRMYKGYQAESKTPRLVDAGSFSNSGAKLFLTKFGLSRIYHQPWLTQKL